MFNIAFFASADNLNTCIIKKLIVAAKLKTGSVYIIIFYHYLFGCCRKINCFECKLFNYSRKVNRIFS